ncbi:hypothetical protein QEH52_18960 [Coraliomargarita sp. SDUM461003]|uniref:DUF5640 domain-containing protein n=1 Tax=Thalassobacterium maritimum TaxID=3041265 RepID=A0ABU1AZQ8_9BACT|nr:hypothetical protein [Coraliomargarita sp. SDUM461003]MDQ8209607.1 hypothetical protein [Coraliomargarita sp. SDUM461003]
MNKTISTLIALMLLLSISCIKENETLSMIIGTWEASEGKEKGVLTFDSDMSVTLEIIESDKIEGTFEIKEKDKLFVYLDDDGEQATLHGYLETEEILVMKRAGYDPISFKKAW